jgi:hypothetical protein
MIADPWHDKATLTAVLFDPDAFEKSIDLVYFDIPQLHQFSEAGDEFFALLE